MSDPTDDEQRAPHLFKPGQSGNPSGRPKGSRNRLGEAFITDLYADWMEHGKEAIATVRAERPHDYLKVTASILPKQVEVKTDAFDGISDEELASLVAVVRAAIDPAGESAERATETQEPQPTGGVPTLQ